jgi:hypothetical protein
MRFDHIAILVFILAIIFVVYQDIAYMAHEIASTPVADHVYDDGSSKGTTFVQTNARK